jgi:hypothetical protein
MSFIRLCRYFYYADDEQYPCTERVEQTGIFVTRGFAVAPSFNNPWGYNPERGTGDVARSLAGDQVKGELLLERSTDSSNRLSLWRFKADFEPVELADNPPDPGDTLQLVSYTSIDWREWLGQMFSDSYLMKPKTQMVMVIEHLEDGSILTNGKDFRRFRGAGAFNDNGQLVGILVGSKHRRKLELASVDQIRAIIAEAEDNAAQVW